jgi:excisionase family DNA binding protein
MLSSTIDRPIGLLTETAAAKLLNLSTRTLQSWRLKQQGPSFVRAGRAVRYRQQDLDAWILSNIVNFGSRPDHGVLR